MSNIVDFKPVTETGPTNVNGKVPPRRVANQHLRSREFLTEKEIEALVKAAKQIGRHGHRDATMIQVAYRHGLRVSELISLKWDQVNLDQGLLYVTRAKGGTPATHPLQGPTIRALRKLKRNYPATAYCFVTERKGPITGATVRKIVSRAGEKAGVGFPVHPHMLRHSTGYKLANDGVDTRSIQAYLGHKAIQHTVRYTELAPNRFNNFWKD